MSTEVRPNIRVFTVQREDAEMLHNYIQEAKQSVVAGLLAFIEDMRCEGRGIANGSVVQFLLDWGLLAERLRDKTWDELCAETGERTNFVVYERGSLPSSLSPMEIVEAVSRGEGVQGTL